MCILSLCIIALLITSFVVVLAARIDTQIVSFYSLHLMKIVRPIYSYPTFEFYTIIVWRKDFICRYWHRNISLQCKFILIYACLIHKGSSKRSCKIATKIYAWSWTLFITTFLWIHVITLHYFSSKITLSSSIRCVWRKVIFLPVIYTCLILSSNLQDTKLIKETTNKYVK